MSTMSNRVQLADEKIEGHPVLFQIISARVVEKYNENNKHVMYTIQVRRLVDGDDLNPIAIERRYTQFHNLYCGLKQCFPNLLSAISFPRKVLIGNFDNELIETRSTDFETLLKLISSDSRLLNTPAVLSFLQDTELFYCKEMIKEQQFTEALPKLEINFRLLNKVYTDRSKPVLMALCRLIGCCISVPGSPFAEKWIDLALHRYNGVSDSDLLTLYVPLLHLAIKVYKQHDMNIRKVEDSLNRLTDRGICVTNAPSLIDALNNLEET